jgi:peptidoglycan/LPS O-acetylase OafA/YrhL
MNAAATPLEATPARAGAPRIPELDGIRGVAISLVLVWHYVVALLPYEPRPLFFLRRALGLTWTGVDLFFVLSGFLIGGILLEARQSPRYFSVFYLRRSIRILPLAFLYLFTIVWLDRAGVLQGFIPEIPFWTYFVFLQNWGMAMAQKLGPNATGVTWSLAVEEQFYLVLPLAIRYVPARLLPPVVACACLLAPVARVACLWMGNQRIAPYVLLPCRIDAFGLGVLLAMGHRNPAFLAWVQRRRRQLWAALGVLLAGMGLLLAVPSVLLMNTVGYSWIALFYAVGFTLCLTDPAGPIATVCRWGPLRWMGMGAYFIYLAHPALLELLHNPVLALAACLLLAAVSWKFVEQPMMRFAHRSYRY